MIVKQKGLKASKQYITYVLLGVFALNITTIFAQQENLSKAHSTSKYSIQKSDRWTKLFKRQMGWTGGDGIYSIQLHAGFQNPMVKKGEKNILFLFSDSIIDTLVNGNQTGNGFTMVHNAVAILNGLSPDSTQIHFHWQKRATGHPGSVFMPTNQQKLNASSDDSIYYWLGDGIALHNKTQQSKDDPALAIFAYKMINTSSEPFGFKDIANDLLLTDPQFKIIKTIELPVIAEGNFGAGIYQENNNLKTKNKPSISEEPFIYIYGVRGIHKGLIVARTTKMNLTKPKNWEYYTGQNWVKDIHQLKDITAHVSNELSVTKTPDGRYALIYQLDGIQPYIGMKLSPTPYGPFSKMDTLWHCTEPTAGNKLLVYNAKAHPSISPSGKLLISYNVNSLDFLNKLSKEPTFYRPRFLLLTWQKTTH